ncbi:MAG: hydrogenase formation protein HypD [Syntrophorhabdales bacterium]|jgi:hydrogenase expression/formation protein HypD
MKNSQVFSSPKLVRNLTQRIGEISTKPLKIMEFCGTHSHAIYRYGIRQLLPKTIQMFSGPGCPVCVTDGADIDYALALAHVPKVVVATFGDLLRVPGSNGSLLTARAEGARVEIVYSPLDALSLAAGNPDERVVFLGIGFETTAPMVAASIIQAKETGLTNYSVFSVHKLTPPAMKAILEAHEIALDGILCPGHVSVVTGWEAWRFLPDHYRLPSAVAGFEPVDILMAIEEIVRQHEAGVPEVKNVYPRGVTAKGNLVAKSTMERVFKMASARWRGLGTIPCSGLALREEYSGFDALRVFGIEPIESEEPVGCHCGEVIRGVMAPNDCPLFRSVCTPVNPVGPCMVSSEGSCAACYLYG